MNTDAIRNEAAFFKSRFGATEQKALEVASTVLGSRVPGAKRLLGAAISPTGAAYYFTDLIGEGGFGEVYIASRDSSDREEFIVKKFVLDEDEAESEPINNELVPGFAQTLLSSLRDIVNMSAALIAPGLTQSQHEDLKKDHDPYEFTNAFVEREFLVSVVISRRLGHSFCEKRVVCAIERFYTKKKDVGFIVFRFQTRVTLARFLADGTHRNMRQYIAQLAANGFQRLPMSALVKMAKTQNDQSEKAATLLSEFRTIQVGCVDILHELAFTLAELHQKNIFHKDIKAENVIMHSLKPLLIDFGLSCVTDYVDDALFETKERKFLDCGRVYETTPDFEDPLARFIHPETEAETIAFFAKFDTYAFAKLAQMVFDPATLETSSGYGTFIVIRKTPFMPAAIHQLLVEMTGEDGYEPPTGLHDYYDVQLSEADTRDRLQYFVSRPSMSQVTIQLSKIIQQLYEGQII